MDFILPLPSLQTFSLFSLSTISAILTPVFAANLLQTSTEENLGGNVSQRLKFYGLACLVATLTLVGVNLIFFWQEMPWYAAIILVGLAVLYIPPLEPLFCRQFNTMGASTAFLLVINISLVVAIVR